MITITHAALVLYTLIMLLAGAGFALFGIVAIGEIRDWRKLRALEKLIREWEAEDERGSGSDHESIGGGT